jgi:hypothetical protein
MSTTSNPAMETFVVVATIRDDTNFDDFGALRDDEHRQLELLHSEEKIGFHLVAGARRTVFLEVMATDEEQVVETLATLPFNKFFDLDIYPISGQS